MSREGKQPFGGRCPSIYKRLENVELLNKIPDRFDPNTIFSEDEDSSLEENRLQDESGVSNFSGNAPKISENIPLRQQSYEVRVEKFNKLYEDLKEQISNMGKKPKVKPCVQPFPRVQETDSKLDDSSKSVSKTSEFTYPFQQSDQQSANSSFASMSSLLGRQLFADSAEKKYDPKAFSGKVLWRSSNVFKTKFSNRRGFIDDSFLENTSANTSFSLFGGQLEKPAPHAPRKAQAVRSLKYDFPKNVPIKLELEGDSFLHTEKKFSSSSLKYPLFSFQQEENPVMKVDAACSPIQYQSESTEEILLVNDKEFYILSEIGSGGSSKVFAAFDKETKTVVAIKRVNIASVDVSIKDGLLKEMEYLTELHSSNHVIKLLDFECRKNEMFFVMEKGDTDFAHFLNDAKAMKSLTPLMVKFYWSQMLTAVSEIHRHRIVHSDLKPANFLLVSGHLKLIDFGISASVPTDMTGAIRSSQVGTINYMSPEAVVGFSANDNQQSLFKIGVKSDVWSLGCILYNLVYGYTPFQKIRFFAYKLDAITNPDYVIPFPPIDDVMLLDVLKLCLKRNPKERASVEELLNHPYLKIEEHRVQYQLGEDMKDLMAKIIKLSPPRQSAVAKFVERLSAHKEQA